MNILFFSVLVCILLAFTAVVAVLRNRRLSPGSHRSVDGHSHEPDTTTLELRELRIIAEKYEKTFMAGPDVAAITRLGDGKILDVSENYFRFTGYTREEVIGRSTLELDLWVSADERRIFADIIRKTGECLNFETSFRSKDGRVVPSLISARAIVLEGEVCIISHIRDITDRKQMETRMAQSQKMEAMGLLAGGVAHDFNNLLTVIRGYCELIQKHPDNKDLTSKRIQQIDTAAQSAAELTRQLLAFSSRQVIQPRVLELNPLIVRIEKMVRRLIGEDIELASGLDPRLDYIRADPGQIEQVIVNLAINARDSMVRGGKVLIETRNVSIDGPAKKLEGMDPGRYVLLSVTDSGRGMDEETRLRIFEPFFTTKSGTGGTGLGLSIVYGIVKQSGGSITVSSEPGHGTSFSIYFPRADELPETDVASVVQTEYIPGGETILLVEDEDAVRSLISKTLGLRGYHIIEASNGENAIQLFRESQSDVQLVITDIVMPRMSGPVLINTLLESGKPFRVLYMSGYDDSRLSGEPPGPAGMNFIQKPFSPTALLQKVREVLENDGISDASRGEG